MRALWHDDTHDPLPRRAGTVVIGAGVAGLSAARALVEAGDDCLVLERDEVGAGASTRNAGYLMRGGADNYAAGVRALGRTRTRDLWRATEQNLDDLLALGLADVETFERRPSTLLAYDEDEARDLEASAALMREDAFDVELATTGDDTLWTHAPPINAFVNPHDATINPARLIAWLRTLVRCPVHERTPVHALDPDGTHIIVRTARADVRAERVLVCTNAWSSRLVPGLPVEPNRGQMCALRVPASVRLDHAYYANRGSEYIRQSSPDTVVVGGWRKHFAADERTDEPAITDDVQRALERFAVTILGDGHEVTHRWSGVMGFTPDGLPLAGPTTDPRLWVCAGFTGHGMSLAHRTATLTARAMLDDDTPPTWTTTPKVVPRPARA